MMSWEDQPHWIDPTLGGLCSQSLPEDGLDLDGLARWGTTPLVVVAATRMELFIK